MEKDAIVYVTGAATMIGAAIRRALVGAGFTCVLDDSGHSESWVDSASAQACFARIRPEYVFLAAGGSGGIQANQRYPADLMRDNLLVTCNIVDAAYRSGTKKLLYLASSCCYPREAPQPMRVEHLMTGRLEPTNEAYASAKIAGIKLCEAYRQQYRARFVSAIPANAFGPGDDFSSDNSHVVAALIRKTHEAKVAGAPYVVVWGTGKAEREFIFVDDLADACLFLMDRYDGVSPINIGAETQRLAIRELALLVRDVVGYAGEVRFDTARPDGMPRKILDSAPLQGLGWAPRTCFRSALAATYEDFRTAHA